MSRRDELTGAFASAPPDALLQPTRSSASMGGRRKAEHRRRPREASGFLPQRRNDSNTLPLADESIMSNIPPCSFLPARKGEYRPGPYRTNGYSFANIAV